MLLPRPTLAGAGSIALIGLAAASNEGLPRGLPLGTVVNRSTLERGRKKNNHEGKSENLDKVQHD